MHLLIILGALVCAFGVRGWGWVSPADLQLSSDWQRRWQTALIVFLWPPVLLLMSAIAILWMGPQGQMVWGLGGWWSYGLAVGFVVWAVWCGLQLTVAAWRSVQQLRHCPSLELEGETGRYLETSIPFAAQVGFWQPELVVSQGLLDCLAPDQLEAVLIHEQAHRQYRDTFWFLGLGWLRQLTLWLPHTEALWQELLLLRELRADAWAAQRVDGLVLAESLFLLVNTPELEAEPFCAAFSAAAPQTRLMERVDALLSGPQPPPPQFSWRLWCWFCLALLPLVTVPFHY